MLQNKKVLFIDDEENILNSLRRLLRNTGIEGYFTTDPEEVFRLVQEFRFAIVISDQRMPKLEGVEVLKRVRELSPDTVRVMLTGYADIKSAMRAVNDGNVFRFLAKPWTDQDLHNALQASLQQYELVEQNRRLQKLTAHQNEELKTFNQDLEKMVDERTEKIEQLNGELKAALFSTIKIMGSLRGILDATYEGHSHRVAKIAGHLARDLGLGEQDLYEIQVASFLHDLGSMAPQRGSALSGERESDELRLSAKIISMVPNVGRAAQYVLHQSVPWRSEGALRPADLPLGAKIVGVATTYDRLLHFKGMKLPSPLNALEVIKAGSGSTYDPAVVASLEKYVHSHLAESEGVFEFALGLVEIKPGMVVSRPLANHRGEVLVQMNFVLTQEVIDGLWQRQLNERPIEEIYIYRESLPANSKVA